jgi:hypothetical protein
VLTRLATLALGIALAMPAHATSFVNVLQWAPDVVEYRDFGTGSTYCEGPHFAPNARVEFGVADDDSVTVIFARLDRTWSGAGALALSFDGRARICSRQGEAGRRQRDHARHGPDHCTRIGRASGTSRLNLRDVRMLRQIRTAFWDGPLSEILTGCCYARTLSEISH